jgi:hypothetical protein
MFILYATLHYTTPHDNTHEIHLIHHTTLTMPKMHHTTLHYTTLHYTTLHYTILHYTKVGMGEVMIVPLDVIKIKVGVCVCLCVCVYGRESV